MTWDETVTDLKFNIIGLVTVASALIVSLLNGTILNAFPTLNLPEMNTNDWITIIISALSGIFLIVKIANGVLGFISKRRDMLEDKRINDKVRERMNKSDENAEDS